MSINDNQLQALLDAEQVNTTSGRKVADHTIFNANDAPGEPDDPTWLQILGNFSEYLNKNVMAFLNAGTLGGIDITRRNCVLNSQGFPPTVKVRHTYAAPGATIPWTKEEDREITQVVLHSFGQQWHAFKSSGAWKGRMNTPGELTLYTPEISTNSEWVWIPKGTDAARGFAQWDRFSSALRAIVSAPQPVTAVHYLIDRAGNLYIMADANDIINSSGGLSESCISIGLEEALYLPKDEGGGRPVEATWEPTGDPPGTSGTLAHWDYSREQYITLAILVRKLQNGIPALRTSTHSKDKTVDKTFTGYTMHGHIVDSDDNIIDVSPHFQTEHDWDAFFSLVEQQAHADEFLTWVKKKPGIEGRLQWIDEIVSSLGPDLRGVTQGLVTNPSVYILSGVFRTHQEINKTRADYRNEGATRLANESVIQKQRQGIGTQLEIAAENPLVLPVNDAQDSEPVPLEDSRSYGVDTEGLY